MGTIFDLDFATDDDIGLMGNGLDDGLSGCWPVPRGYANRGTFALPSICPIAIQADQEAEVTMHGAHGEIQSPNVHVRYAGNVNHYFARVNDGLCAIFKYVAAVTTLLSSDSTPVQSPRAYDSVYLLEAVGDNPCNLEFFIDGVSVLTASNATVQLQTGVPGVSSGEGTSTIRKFRAMTDASVELWVADFAAKEKRFCVVTSDAVIGSMAVGAGGLVVTDTNPATSNFVTNVVVPGDGGGVELVFNTTDAGLSGIMIYGGVPSKGYLVLFLSNTSILVFELTTVFVSVGAAFAVASVGDSSDHTLKVTLTGTTIEVFLDTVSLGTRTGSYTIDSFIPGIRFVGSEAQIEGFTIKNLRGIGADSTAPTAPSMTVAKGQGTNGVAVSWNDPDGTDADVTIVKIERAPDSGGSPGAYTELAEWDKDLGEWDETDPRSFLDDPGAGTFHYRVTFTDHDGNSTAALSGAVIVPIVDAAAQPGPISVEASVAAISGSI